MAVQARLADGRILQFPDGTDPSVIQATVQKVLGTQPGIQDFSQLSTRELENAPSAPLSIGDIGRSFGTGVLGAAKSVADVFGAGNTASNYLGEKVRGIQAGLTPEAQAEMARRQELEKRAAASGDMMEEAKAYLGGIAEAPLRSVAQGIGSSAISITAGLASLATGAPAGLALGVGTIARAALGAAQGAGEYKGNVLEEVKQAYIQKGYSEQQAQELAIKAQEYSRENALEIGGTALLGALDAFTGIESGVRRAVSKVGAGRLSNEAIEAGIKALPDKAVSAPSLTGAALRSIAGEAPIEGVQGGFGQYAENLAMQREGLLEGDTTKGVLGSALRDAAVGALVGGAFTPVKMSEMRSDANLDQFLRQTKEQQEFDAEIKAATERAADQPQVYTMPGGYEVTAQDAGQFEAPVEHFIMEEGGTQPLVSVKTEEEVAPKIERLEEIRQQEAQKVLEQIDKISGGVQKQVQELELMEATGQANTPAYLEAKQRVELAQEQADLQVKDLMERNEALTKKLVYVPGAMQTQTQQQFVLSKDGAPVGTFGSLQEAERSVMDAVGPEAFTQAKEQQQQQVLASDQAAELKAKLEPMMAKFGLKDVGLEIADKLEKGAGGKYLNKLISVALDEPNPVQTMRHESVHALKDLGFFTPQQWSALENMAKKKWVNEYLGSQQTEIDGQSMSRLDGYRKLGLTEQEIVEEAIADAFGAFDATKAPPGMLAALSAKLKKFFEALKNGFTGAGFQSAESVFGKIERGDLKGTRQPSGDVKFSVAPKGVPQKIWDLHEKSIAADEAANVWNYGPNKANATKATRRLLKAVADHVGDDDMAQIDFMVKMNEESSRRGESVGPVTKYSLKRAAKKDEVEISTQNPAGKKRVYDPIEQMLSIDEKAVMEVMKTNKEYRAKTIAAIKSYGFIPNGTSSQDAIPLFKKNIVDNLLFLHDLVPKEIRQRSKLWYDGANKISQQMADEYGLSLQQVSSIMAAMSPQKDWFQNVSMGERAIDILTTQGDTAWSPEMLQYAQSYVSETPDRKEREKRQEGFEKIKKVAAKGTVLADMDEKSAAAFIRAYDESFHSRQYRIVTPEGGFGGLVLNNNGTPSTMMWSTYGPLEKTVSIFRDGSRENISQQLGFEHKIRSFYNNIAAPNSDLEHVTIDTHAVAAALFESLAGTDPEVIDNFGGTGSSNIIGVGGTYGLIADAYRDAARQAGVLPREMQSITWEAVRGLFNEDIKSSIKGPVKAEWAKYKNGEQSFEQAREKIIEIAREKRSGDKDVVIPPPDWVNTDEGQFVKDGGESYDKSFTPEGGVRLRESKQLREKVTFNLTAVTDSIPGLRELYARALKQDKGAISALQEVSESSLKHLLSETNAKIKIERANGVFLSDREPSLMVSASFAEDESRKVMAGLAQFAKNFNQKQIHVRMPTNKKFGFDYDDGSYVTRVYTIKLKKELSDKAVSAIIEKSGLQGFTATDKNLIAYFVKSNKEAGETNEQYAKRIEEEFEQFTKSVETALVLAGEKGERLGKKDERLFVYGEGDTAAIPYESIAGNIRSKQGSDTNTPRIIAEYLTGAPVQVSKQKPLSNAQVAQQEKLAKVFDAMPVNDLKNPMVKKAYRALANALKEQFSVIPVKVELQTKKYEEGDKIPENSEVGDIIPPYGNNSGRMRQDMVDRNHLLVYPTTKETFGPKGYDFSSHPLLEDSGLKDINGRPMLYNDVLRAVHDYFAHGMAEAQFGEAGEFTAWRNHMASTPDPLARWALTSETRAQNAWQNFREGAQELLLKDRPFSTQKAFLPPVEFLFTGDKSIDAPVAKMVEELPEAQRNGSLKLAPGEKLSLKQVDLFPKDFANKRTSSKREIVVSSKGATQTIKLPNVNSAGQKITGTVQGLENFWDWYGDGPVDESGKPILLYHSTNADISEFETGRETTNNFGLFGNVTVTRSGIFASPNRQFSQDYLREGAGGNVMPIYMALQNPIDLRRGLTEADEKTLEQAGLSPSFINTVGNDWSLFDNDDDGKSQFVDALKSAGFDGAIIEEDSPTGESQGGDTYIAFDPAQIKSAAGNRGTFSASNPDIRFSIKRVSFPDASSVKEAVKEAGTPDTPEFKKFINRTQLVNPDGTPKVMYHGTSREFFEFEPAGLSQAIFLSDEPSSAQKYAAVDQERVREMAYRALTKDEKVEFFDRVTSKAVEDGDIDQDEAVDIMRKVGRAAPVYGSFGSIKKNVLAELDALSPSRPNIMPLYASGMNLFDYENPEHVKGVSDWVLYQTDILATMQNPDHFVRGLPALIAQGWRKTIAGGDKADERNQKIANQVQKAIRAGGFDGFMVRENQAGEKSYAVYKPTQVKSATGNIGDFSGELKDVRYSLRSVRYSPERFDKLFDQGSYVQNDAEKKTKGYLGFVQPMDFVEATVNRSGLDALRKEEEPLDFAKMRSLGPIGLQMSVQPDGNWKITGHEGRHRMLALHAAGYRDIPVYIEFASAINDAQSIKTKAVPAQINDALSPSLLIAELEPLSMANRDKAAERFMREKPVKYSLPNISAGAEGRINATTTVREEKGFLGRMLGVLQPENYSTYRQQFLNRYNELGVADKEAAKSRGTPNMLAEESAEHAALMSDMSAGVTASAFGIGSRSGGVPVIKNGLTTIDTSKKGLLEVLQPLARYNDPKAYRYFQFYSAVKRGARLYQEGRERLINPGDIAFANELALKFPEFEQIRKDWVAYNNDLVAYQKDAGVLSDRDAVEYTKHYDYIPFFRQLDGKRTIGPNIYQSISGVKKPKKLEGGEAPLADFLETVVRNSQSAIAAGMKNIAAQRARDVGKQAGVVHDIPPGASVSDTEKIKVLEKGVLREYQSDDPLFIDAVKSLHMPDIPFLGLLSGPSNFLREAITRDPGFILANLMRDSLSAYATSGQKITPVVDTVKNFGKAYARRSPGFEALMNAGVIGGYEFSENVEQSGRTVAKELAKRAGNKGPLALRPFTSLWDGLEKATTASDAATRVAIYDRVLQETGSENEAIRAAWEVMNFNRKGSSPIIRVLTAAVPFMNARLQGLDVFYRAATGQMTTTDPKLIQRRFIARAAMMFATSLLYAAAVSGDEEYEKQEEETKDNNWIISSLGIKIPIPFEVGTLFKTIPERIYRYSFGNDTGQDLRDALWRATLTTLPINPVGYIPQVFKPMIEATTNYNMFTKREIVGPGMKDVAPEFQVGPGTSTFSTFVGQTLGLSPIKVDHVIKGYTGTMGMYAIDVIDSIMNLYGDSPKPTKRFEQMPVIKRFTADPEARGNVTAYYKLKDEVDTVVRTVNLLEKSMKPDEYAKYVEKNIGTLAFKDYVSDMEKSMKQFREMRKVIMSSSMSGDDKRDALTGIGQAESNLTANIQTIKKAISETQ